MLERLIVLPDTGHMAPLERPAEIARRDRRSWPPSRARESAPRQAAAGRLSHAHRSLHRPRQRDHRPARRDDRRRRWRADDADADPAVRRHAVGGDLERPRRRGGDAADRRRRAPARRHGQPAAGAVDGARLGAGRVPRRLPAAPAGHAKRAQQNIEVSLGAALLVGAGRDGAAVRARPPRRPSGRGRIVTTSSRARR